MTIYRGNFIYTLFVGLFFFAVLSVLTLSLFASAGPVMTTQYLGLAALWFLATCFTLFPFTCTLEIGNDYVKTYYLGFKVFVVRAADVKSVRFEHDAAYIGLKWTPFIAQHLV
jgi:hypothetical protein